MTPKETAVEWLYNRFLFAGYAVPNQWKEEALKMEKEQRMYSEGEVLELLRKSHFIDENIDEWFEQFKKK